MISSLISSTSDRSWGVSRIICCFGLSTAKFSRVLRLTFLFTASMKTSNSSAALKGLSHSVPRARMNARVLSDLSPPERDFMSLTLRPALPSP